MGSTTCPICFENLAEKIRASPDSCDHIFCLPCLEKWSKLGSYCPVDRKRYKKILNLDSDHFIKVKPRKRKRVKATLYDFSTVCEICSKDNNPDVLLLCDCCDLSFHLCCLTPPLKKIPAGLWFCPPCINVEKKLKEKNGITKEVEADDCSGKKISYKESKIKTKKTEKVLPVCCKDNSIVEACHNIITEFEDITVNRNFNKDISNPSISYDSFNKMNKICKTFDFETKNESHKQSRYVKTYDLPSKIKKKDNSKPPAQDKIYKVLKEKLKNSNDDDICLKNGISKDINLLERYLSDSIGYGYMEPDIYDEDEPQLCETHIQKSDINEERNQNQMCSATNSSQLEQWNHTKVNGKGKFLESTLQRKTSFEKEIENSSLNDKNIQETYPAAKSSMEGEMKISKPVFTENTDDVDVPSCKTVLEGSSKEKGLKKVRQHWRTDDYQPTVGLCKTSNLDFQTHGRHYSYFYKGDLKATFTLSKPSNKCIATFGKSSCNSSENQLSTICKTKYNSESNHAQELFYNEVSNDDSIAKFGKSSCNSSENQLSTICKTKYNSESNHAQELFYNEVSNICGGNDAFDVTDKEEEEIMLYDFDSIEKNDSELKNCLCSYQPSDLLNEFKSYPYCECQTLTNTSAPKENYESRVDPDMKSENSVLKSNISPYLIPKDCSNYSSDFKKKMSSNHKFSSISHSDLKYLTILNDGTFFLDKCTSKYDKSLTSSLLNSINSDCYNEIKTFNRSDLKYLTFLKDGTFVLKKPIAFNDKLLTSPLQNSGSSSDCTEKKSCYQNDLKNSIIKKEKAFSLEKPRFENDKALLQNFGNSSCYSENKAFNRSDLKYLTFLKDGTFVIKKPIKSDDKSLISPLQNSGSSDDSNESETCNQNDLRNSTIKKEKAFLLEKPRFKVDRVPLHNSGSSDDSNKSETCYQNDLRNSTIKKEKAFLLGKPRFKVDRVPLHNSGSSDDSNESETCYQKDLRNSTIKKEKAFLLEKPRFEVDKVPLHNSDNSNCYNGGTTFNRSDLKYLTLLKDGTIFLEKSFASEDNKSLTSPFQNSGSSGDCNENEICYQNDLKNLPIKNEETVLPKSENDKALMKPLQPSESSCSKNNAIYKSDLKYLTIKKDGSFVLEFPN